ncbi:MAG: hypothetical protein R3D63_02555 [Paracoccaceae bacterium]
MPTRNSPATAIGASRSMSRSISVPLVVIASGWRQAASTSTTSRITRILASTGW